MGMMSRTLAIGLLMMIFSILCFAMRMPDVGLFCFVIGAGWSFVALRYGENY
jgi:hypothetical protein